MLYYLHLLQEHFSPLRIFQYVTVRTFMAGGTAFFLSLWFGPAVIRMLHHLKFGQQVRDQETPGLNVLHAKKRGTPTMGGVLIIGSVFISTLLWADPSNGYVWLALATMLFLGGVGFLDDFIKIKKKRSKGLSARQKFLLQVFWALVVVAALLNWPDPKTQELTRQLFVPFLKDPLIRDMSMIGVAAFVLLVLVGSSNAVNLTDGLDGLAIGCSNSVAMAYLVLSYVAGHAIFAEHLLVPRVPGASELTILCGSLLGAGLGFLWFNCHPARVFMGDTGSLSIGGVIAVVAILIKQELLLVIVGGVFVMEALSVVIQVASFKSTGRRVFKCAPIHHHFELLEKERAEKEGRDLEVVETMIIIRFWILSIVFALIGIATLKLR